MKDFLKKMQRVPRGLRHKLMISFALMSIIPLLVCAYLVSTFIMPQLESAMQVSVIVFLSLGISALGLLLAGNIIDPIIRMALEAKRIADGDFGSQMSTDRGDEIGDLGRSINVITDKIKSHMAELQAYSVKTREINIEIQRKVSALSSLLEISDRIATSGTVDDVLNVVTQKTSTVFTNNFTTLFLAKGGTVNMLPSALYNTDKRPISNLSFNMDRDYIGTFVKKKKALKIDAATKQNKDMIELCNKFRMKSCFIAPVISNGIGIGFLLTGNDSKDFVYTTDNMEFVILLAKQLSIAIENENLTKRVRETTVKDEATDLFNEKFIRERLDEEIERAILYQRPCSFALFNVDNFKDYVEKYGKEAAKEAIKKIGILINEAASDISKVGKLEGDEFAILLPEKNKREALKTADEIRKKVEASLIKAAGKGEKPLTLSGSISENPIDGTSADELFNKAHLLLKKAKKEAKSKIYL